MFNFMRKMFSSPSSSYTPLLPSDRSREPGKSISDFSMAGVHETKKGLKFVRFSSEKYIGRFTVLIFMDNKLEIMEWKDFSDHLKEFKHVGASMVGVCTDRHIG